MLDVGHGNCAVVQSGEQIAVIDAPLGSLLLDTLRDFGITRVQAAFISHADSDHLGEILALLTSSDVRVDTIYVNPDSNKRSQLWEAFRAAVHVAERDGTCVVRTSLSTTQPGTVHIGEAQVRVVSPSAALALTGVGGRIANGRTVSANSLSAALCVETVSGKGVLLAGDMDALALDDSLESGANLSADVLVYPHHGGSPGGNAADFTGTLIAAVKPHSVFFSNGRNRHENPQASIVDAVLDRGCAVACTQLAHACSDLGLGSDHLEAVRALGRDVGYSCAGSVTLALSPMACRLRHAAMAHETFVSSRVRTPLCRARNMPAGGQLADINERPDSEADTIRVHSEPILGVTFPPD